MSYSVSFAAVICVVTQRKFCVTTQGDCDGEKKLKMYNLDNRDNFNFSLPGRDDFDVVPIYGRDGFYIKYDL